MIKIKNLELVIKAPHTTINPVKNINIEIQAGEIFVLVGESGSGKSLTALSIMRLLPHNCYYGQNSKIEFANQDLLELTERQMQAVRGSEIGMIFQDPGASLNPLYTMRQQLQEAIHTGKKSNLNKLLFEVQIPDPERILNSYPHQLSGGLKQRVMLAIALANKPKLLIADEPTTALDATTQVEILKLLLDLRAKHNMSILLITHNFAVAHQVADRVGVMYDGELLEIGPKIKFFENAEHEYSKKLLSSIPKFTAKTITTIKPKTQSILQVNNLSVNFNKYTAIKNINFAIQPGEVVALVGNSGCGKSTTAKAILNLLDNYSGKIFINNKNIKAIKRKDFCRLVQIIFQDPYSSLDPKMTIEQILTEGPKFHNIEINVDKLLNTVGLKSEHKNRYPHEYSGGQRQRLAIARALAMQPKLIICDEPTSALDLIVQDQVLQILRDLRETQNLSYLFITHDLAVVSYMADRILVMQDGEIIEHGDTEQILYRPKHEFTQRLLEASGFWG